MKPYLDDGDVRLLLVRRGPFPVPISERFWCKATMTAGGCWEWLAGRYPNGYGCISGRLAHRVAWELTRGIIPPGWLVLHRCANKGCVRPDHLYLGNKRQNLRDCKADGQYRELTRNPRRGEDHPQARLTLEQVKAIRADGRTQDVIGREFGVSQAAVSMIRSGKRWN